MGFPPISGTSYNVPSVTADRIAAVQAHITEAVTRTSASSTLPEKEQDRLLAQGCAEACDLLKDWLDDPWWDRIRSSGEVSIKESVPSRKEFEKFLGPMLKDSLARARKQGVNITESLVDEARDKVAATSRRYPRMSRQQLLDEARDRVSSLRREVCGLAAETRGTRSAGWGRKARKALGKMSGVLLAITLAMAGASPHAAAQNAAEWGHAAVGAIEVITVHQLAASAGASAHVAPARSGPRLR